jgi:hypothetical protein
MSSIDMYVDVRNVISGDDLTALNRLQLSLNEDYCRAAKISSEQLLPLLFNNK